MPDSEDIARQIAEEPILEAGVRSLRQDIAMVLRAESHGALPPELRQAEEG